MGSEGLGPTARQTVVEDGGHHGLLELGVVSEEERCLGICQVHGVDTTVRVVLL